MPKEKDTKSLIQEAYREIKRLMLQRKLKAGQKLLYRELIDQLHMSKTPIINALNRLEQEGFITSETNYGYYIKPIEQKEIMDSHDVREALETKAIQRAISIGTQADFAILTDRLRAYQNYKPYKYDIKKFVLNADFHIQIASISGNNVLKYLLKRNMEHIILRTDLDNYSPERMDKAEKDHAGLLNGIQKKDVSRCTELIRIHIQETRDEIIRCLSGEELNNLESMSFFKDDY